MNISSSAFIMRIITAAVLLGVALLFWYGMTRQVSKTEVPPSLLPTSGMPTPLPLEKIQESFPSRGILDRVGPIIPAIPTDSLRSSIEDSRVIQE